MKDIDQLISEGRAVSDIVTIGDRLDAVDWLEENWPDIEAALVAAEKLQKAVKNYLIARGVLAGYADDYRNQKLDELRRVMGDAALFLDASVTAQLCACGEWYPCSQVGSPWHVPGGLTLSHKTEGP